MVGWYSQAGNTPASGFLLRGGNFTFLNYPGAYSTVARSINDSGLIAGYAEINGVRQLLVSGTTERRSPRFGMAATLTPSLRESTMLAILSAATAILAQITASSEQEPSSGRSRRPVIG
jgi:hypothetical protein